MTQAFYNKLTEFILQVGTSLVLQRKGHTLHKHDCWNWDSSHLTSKLINSMVGA